MNVFLRRLPASINVRGRRLFRAEALSDARFRFRDLAGKSSDFSLGVVAKTALGNRVELLEDRRHICVIGLGAARGEIFLCGDILSDRSLSAWRVRSFIPGVLQHIHLCAGAHGVPDALSDQFWRDLPVMALAGDVDRVNLVGITPDGAEAFAMMFNGRTRLTSAPVPRATAISAIRVTVAPGVKAESPYRQLLSGNWVPAEAPRLVADIKCAGTAIAVARSNRSSGTIRRILDEWAVIENSKTSEQVKYPRARLPAAARVGSRVSYCLLQRVGGFVQAHGLEVEEASANGSVELSQ